MDLLIIGGPTGIGKTSLSVDIASKYKMEIISADSMQVYRGMDIGTAKISKEEMHEVPHHMMDMIRPDEQFTVEDFQSRALELINDIHQKGKKVLITGGSGLYIDSILYDLDFAQAPPNYEIRTFYEEELSRYGKEYLHRKLEEIDPVSAQRIHINQTRRLIRALEVYHTTGIPYSKHGRDRKSIREQFSNVSYYALDMERETLYDRINQRVDKMIENGLLEEVKGLLSKGYDSGLKSMQAIGYKEMIAYIRGDYTWEEAVRVLKKHSRNLAKRQWTWFNNDPNAISISKEELGKIYL